MSNLSASFLFSGYGDYWSGFGGRGLNCGCAFAYYGRGTTLRDLVDQWVDDVWDNECDFAGLPDSVTPSDVRNCIVESFTDAGRADYINGAVCGPSADWSDYNPLTCRDCGAEIDGCHCDDCSVHLAFVAENPDEYECTVVEEDCDDDECDESPVAIMLISWVVCEDCSNLADPESANGTLCAVCNEKHYGSDCDV